MRTRSAVCSELGFSLFEIIVALGVAASVIAMGAGYLGNRPASQLREEATQIIQIVRYAYFQAAAESRYYRVVFDLDDNTYHVESSETPFYIVREDDEKEALRKKNEDQQKETSSLLDEGEAPPASAPAPSFAESEDDILKVFQLPGGIKISDIFVLHQKDKQEEGKAYLYFFPRGRSEFAVIHLGDTEGERFLTLVVNPLTAAVEVRQDYLEYEEILEEYGGK